MLYIFAGLWVNAATYLPCRYIKSWHFCESVHLIWTFMKFVSSSHCGNCSDCKCCHMLTLPRLPSFGQVCCDYCWFSHDDYKYSVYFLEWENKLRTNVILWSQILKLTDWFFVQLLSKPHQKGLLIIIIIKKRGHRRLQAMSYKTVVNLVVKFQSSITYFRSVT